ncbi:hypothetical protein [Aeromicrobium sp. Leaf350]|uniref:hypothetical protein n=1 Tax=Aeromicrobium sp. Leaf350 TaxID=2876565 RepID=UPI001E29F718|nr:hypothetical protein [Aeromicrobium sp. Leaf350]
MSTFTEDQLEAIQNVVDRVSSYQDGAPEGTVADELRKGLDEADVTVEEDQLDRLAQAIDAADGDVNASDVLG